MHNQARHHDHGPANPSSDSSPLHVDCRTCRARGPACDDCVITLLLGPPEVDLGSDEQQALGALAQGGLLPPLRVVPVSPSTPDE